MSVLETLKKQAAALEASGNNSKVADLLEQAAKLLRQNEPKHESFAAIKKQRIDARAARLEKFGAAMQKNKIEKQEEILKSHGWEAARINKNERVYGQKGTAGYYSLTISEGKFSIHQNSVKLLDKTDVIALNETLHAFKKQIK